jgi:hypothetical protein
VRGLSNAILAGLLALSFSPPASADSKKDEAQRHFEAGLGLVETEDYDAATAEFEASVQLFPTKMGLFNLANCYKALHRYGEALDVIDRLKQEFAGKLGDLDAEVAGLERNVSAIVGRLEIDVNQDGAAISVDGTDVATSPLAKPLVLAPGDHSVTVRLTGYASQQRTIRITTGKQQAERFDLAPGPAGAVASTPAAPSGTTAPPAMPPRTSIACCASSAYGMLAMRWRGESTSVPTLSCSQSPVAVSTVSGSTPVLGSKVE